MDGSVKCGHTTSHTEISSFKLVDGPKSNGKKENVIKAAAGITFSIVLTDTGKGGRCHSTESRLWMLTIRAG
jgi:hypothetical protein